jgi:hypothetical protein
VTGRLDRQAILDAAARETGLHDFGPDYFLEPMGRLIDSINVEARLSPAGAALQHGRMVSHMVGRLRMFDMIARHPEIAEERVDVAAVICGLPRTGSTMFHRMLATASGFTAVRWWETQNYAPFPGETRGDPAERRRTAERIMDGYVKAGMMAIHPFAIEAPDEEIIILDQFFVGTMPEGGMYVPSYSAWLAGYDHRAAYRDLVTVLKFLQWQDVSRVGKRWVLKTPGHLPTVETLFETFSDAVLIMTHRDPAQTVPSYCSMTESLYRMYSDRVDPVELGRFTEMRWAGFLKHFTEARERLLADRFIDVRYEDLVTGPLEQARRVLARLNVPMNPDTEAAMGEWLEENAREKRAAHHYDTGHFGLTDAGIRQDFAGYISRFLD